MKSRLGISVACCAVILFSALQGHSQDPVEKQAEASPLAPFEQIIGGQWHYEGTYQEFEWGVGQLSVKGRNYFLVDGEPKLISEGSWYWHPGEKQIKGAFTAINMPVVFFDYTTRFEENQMVSDLRAYGPNGGEASYVETWGFVDETHFVWKLWQETPDGLTEIMGGTYTRK